MNYDLLLSAFIGNRVIQRLIIWNETGVEKTFHKVGSRGWKRVSDQHDSAIIKAWQALGSPTRFNKGV